MIYIIPKTIKSKTLFIHINNVNYIIALMNKLNWHEVKRKYKNRRVQITFCGRESDYHENDYVKITGIGGYYFYSLRIIDGYFAKTIEEFKEQHDKTNLEIEIFSFN